MDQKKEHKELTTAVTVVEMRVIAVYQPVWNDGGAPVELYRTGGRTPNSDVPKEDNPGKRWRPQLASGPGHTKRRSKWKVRTSLGHKRGWGRPPPMV